MKLVLQYQATIKRPEDPKRNIFIARHQSYHGTTFGALGVSGHRGRRANFLDVLPKNTKFISPCYPWRDQNDKTPAEYVAHLKSEFIAKIQEIGPERVAGFIMEPVVGAVSSSRLCSFTQTVYEKLANVLCRHLAVLLPQKGT